MHNEMEYYIKQVDNCLQHEQSFCMAQCPFNLDVNTFISRIQEGRFNAAYKTYRDATGFPFIAGRICTEECKQACLKNAVKGGEPIELLKLEAAVLENAKRIDPTRYNVPGKNKSVAIIGAGISGMACALRLASKKYNVTIYEKTDHTGGSLLNELDPEIVQKDFDLQMQHLDYTIKYNTEITSLEDVIIMGREEAKLRAQQQKSAVAAVMRSSTTNAGTKASDTYDAIYVATGSGGQDFGQPEMIGNTAVFLGGSLLGRDLVHALSDGLQIATAIDNYTLTGIHRYPETRTTHVAIDETKYVTTNSVAGTNSGQDSFSVYTADEAVEESKRCMKCQCSSCQLHCDLLEYLHKWPLRVRDEILATTAPGKSELHATPAVRLINSCTHCGLCKDVCPEDIDLDNLIQQARFRMHKLDKMPWAFNDFFLRDMEFTNSDEAYLCRGSGKYLFFPGCQLGAGAPELVIRSYEYLRGIDPDAGIMLGCCGIPADWAGDEELRSQVTDRIKKEWKDMGKPVMVLACPTCRNTFSRYLPEVETVFIYDIISENGLPSDAGASECGPMAVFDPCATSADDKVRSSVRSICDALGAETVPLSVQEKWTACCSYGGHGVLADPDFTDFVRQKRIDESDLPFITYCINCRDAFVHEGKEAVHLLSLVFGTESSQPTLTERRENRIRLKKQLLEQFWNESTISDEPCETRPDKVLLEIDEEVRTKLSESFILETEAADVVEFCERTGRTLYDTEADTYTGYRKIGNLTYWVSYQKTDKPDTYKLLNAYTHRMEIELEMIWNGEKINIDM